MMKAFFKNIGPIKEAELELGDLTIIAGQNNTGKTYLVYTLYGFLSMFDKPNSRLRHILRSHATLDTSESINKIPKQLQETGKAEMPFDEYERLHLKMLKKVCQNFSKVEISHIFNSPNGELGNAYFEMEMTKIITYKKASISLGNLENESSIKVALEGERLVFEFSNHENNKIDASEMTRIIQFFLQQNLRKNFPVPFILSAERFGISLFYKELDFTRNRLVEELQNTDKKRFNPFRFIENESARYATPIRDNIDFTRDLPEIVKKGRSGISEDKHHSIKKIMDGYYKSQSDEIRFISNRRGDNRFNIPLHLASSSVRGVSDLYFYLKHIAKPGQMLIVDEPESHLSPTNQILMARLLAFCVRSGLKVLITTHSDYLIKEINNLIMLHGDFDGKTDFLQRHKEDYSAENSLNSESVKAYICENGSLSNCQVDADGINMSVFDDAIDKINQISNELGLLITPGTPDDD